MSGGTFRHALTPGGMAIQNPFGRSHRQPINGKDFTVTLRRFTLGILFAFIVAGWAAAVDASGRGLTIKLRGATKDAGVTESVKLYGSSHALVIGIDDYRKGWPRLSNAVKDARAVAAALRKSGFDVTLKLDLTSRQLKDAFEQFFVFKGENPEARLFVWFAGHGHSEDGEGFLIPKDAPRPSAGARFRVKALSLRRFGEYVRLAKSKHAFSVFDSCFSGTIFETARSAPPPAITHATTAPVRQFLSSGDAGQKVSDDGRFRRLFIEALNGRRQADANGDGYLTASELGLFLSDSVTNYSNRRQTPRYGKLNDPNFDRGDFVFQLTPSRPIHAPSKPHAAESAEADRAGAKSKACGRHLFKELSHSPSQRLKDYARLGGFIYGEVLDQRKTYL